MVGVTLRPDVDWTAARAAFEAGENPSSIARRLGVSRQAVMKHRDKEGWTRTPEAGVLAQTATMQRIEQPQTGADKRMLANGKRTASAMQRILDMLSTGSTVPLAARRVGMTPDALHDWFKSDPAFQQAADAAMAEFGAGLIQTLVKAGERDWRSHAHLMERHPATKDELSQQAPPGGSAPAVVLNLHLAPEIAAVLATPPAPAALVINHEPDGDDDSE